MFAKQWLLRIFFSLSVLCKNSSFCVKNKTPFFLPVTKAPPPLGVTGENQHAQFPCAGDLILMHQLQVSASEGSLYQLAPWMPKGHWTTAQHLNLSCCLLRNAFNLAEFGDFLQPCVVKSLRLFISNIRYIEPRVWNFLFTSFVPNIFHTDSVLCLLCRGGRNTYRKLPSKLVWHLIKKASTHQLSLNCSSC